MLECSIETRLSGHSILSNELVTNRITRVPFVRINHRASHNTSLSRPCLNFIVAYPHDIIPLVICFRWLLKVISVHRTFRAAARRFARDTANWSASGQRELFILRCLRIRTKSRRNVAQDAESRARKNAKTQSIAGGLKNRERHRASLITLIADLSAPPPPSRLALALAFSGFDRTRHASREFTCVYRVYIVPVGCCRNSSKTSLRFIKSCCSCGSTRRIFNYASPLMLLAI